MKEYISISQEVSAALRASRPLVALESTIISHGMPYPENVKMARKVEEIIRGEGAVPATIAIIDGTIRVGLSVSELSRLAQDPDVLKVSKPDIAYAVSQKRTGATTVSATMLISDSVGIRVFSTGGIGGVHRDGENTMDVSRDLEELADTNVLVVCAGAKSILDLPRTLEYLETKGVEVIGYRTDVLPAFYAKESPFALPIRLDDVDDITALMKAKWELGLKGGIVLANPIPSAYAMDYAAIERVIERALDEAEKSRITGKRLTPFLLSRIEDMTGGKSLSANLELVYNNALLAARIAVSYQKKCTK
ncbi:MAG: pseudouridine-5'-phosphate glycosidase [Acholeplasmataceae bacterium]